MSIITISGVSDILQELRDGIVNEKSIELLKSQLLNTIGFGDKFSSKALRLLSGRLPFKNSSNKEDETRKRIREIIEAKKSREVDIDLLLKILNETGFIREKMNAFFRSISLVSLVRLHNHFFDTLTDGANLEGSYEKYRNLFHCMETQIGYKIEASQQKIEISGNIKIIYGPGITINDKKTTDSRKIAHYKITESQSGK